MAHVVRWFSGLGAKKTPRDPTGSKHRVAFWLVIALFLTPVITPLVRADAMAAPVCRSSISGKSPQAAGFADAWAKLQFSGWCGGTQAGASWDGGAPTYSRTWGEGTYTFIRWFDTKIQTGRTTAPNGTPNVQYKAVWVAAEFKICIGVGPAQVCTHKTEGVRIWAFANGNYTIRPNATTQTIHATPYLPMPRP